VFLVYFKPFGITYASYGNSQLAIAFFGFLSGIVFVLLFYVFPIIFPKVYDDKVWKVWHQMLLLIVAVLLIATLNGLYINYMMGLTFSWSNYSWIITRTFALASIPICIIVLIDYNRKLKKHLAYASRISVTSNNVSQQVSDDIFMLMDNQEIVKIQANDILYLEAEGNYINVVLIQEDKEIKMMLRTSLSRTQKDNDVAYILRCHRSYIVNLRKVKTVSGNAQGLKLLLHDTNFVVPVSRSYISEVQAHLT